MTHLIYILALTAAIAMGHKAWLAWQMGPAARVDAVGLTAATAGIALMLVEYLWRLWQENR